jgi:cytochrome c-type biogenesis protein CcmF
LAAWIFLTIGLFLGALWSYGVLGWGGYWAWDPVENVALLPWLMATAFLHSVIIQERRGMLKVWNLSLIVGTFALTTFGTFLTRGSILSSVHAFARTLVGPLYLAMLVVVLVGGFGLIAARSWRLRSEGRFDAALSRESAFLANNLVLLALTFVILLGTIFPLAVEAITGRQSSVGGPYFDQTTVPLFLLLLFLMGVGPLLPWRRGTAEQLTRRVTVPAAAAAVVMAGAALLGMRSLAGVLGFGLATFVAVANGDEIVRGVRSYGRATGSGAIASVVGVTTRNRRLYGGLVAHVGMAIAAAAVVASATFLTQVEVALDTGQQARFAGYVLTYEGQRSVHQPQRTILVADVTVSRDGRVVGSVHPSLNLYPGASEPIGTPSVRYGAFADLYTSVIGFEGDGGRATFRFFDEHGVLWLWVGGAVIAFGGLLAAWPSRRRRAPDRRRARDRELTVVG